jgi:glycosyltransferase involved in cell wall biosynthesis
VRIFHKECVSSARAGFETYCVVPNAKTRVEEGVHMLSFDVGDRSRLQRFYFTVKQVYQEAIKVNADIYHLHDPELLLIAAKLKKATGAKIVFDSHEDVPKQILDKPWIPKMLRPWISKGYAGFEKRVCKKLDAVVSVTPIICERFSRFHPNVVLVANYPDLTEFDLDNDTKLQKIPRSICYVGGLSETRGIRELVQALAYVDAELHLAGWFESSALEAEIRALPGWEKVKFYGKINRDDVKNLLAQSQIGLVTLLPTASYKEAYPIKMFEYMAAGIPVLASDFPLWRVLAEKHHCAEFVDPNSPKAIAQKLEDMFQNPQLEDLGRNGRQAILNEINWQNEAQKLLGLYKNLSQ